MRFRFVRILMVAIVLAIALAGIDQVVAAGATPTWTVSALSFTAETLSCPDTSHCWSTSLQGGIYLSTDGGTTWQKQYSDPSSGYSFSSLDCTTIANCVAADPNGLVVWTNDGGATWNRSASSLNTVGNLSCPSPSICFAGDVERGVAESKDGGATWTQLALPSLAGLVDCPSTTVCYALGNSFMSTNDGGTQWQSFTPPTTAYPIYALTCPTTLTCLALSNEVHVVFRTTDGGDSWFEVSVPPVTNVGFGASQGEISCPTESSCFITDSGNTTPEGGIILQTKDAGATWTQVQLPTNDVDGQISCPTVLACYVVGGTGFMTDVSPVSDVSASLSSYVVASVATVTTTFTTSAIGAIPAGGTITLEATPGTEYPSSSSDYAISDGTGASDAVGSVSVGSSGANVVTLTLSQSGIAATDGVTIAVADVTNPTFAEGWTLTVSTSTDPVPATSLPMALTPGPVSLSLSTIDAYPALVLADGSSPFTIDVTLVDGYGNAEPGEVVGVTQSATGANIAPASATTNSAGVASFTLTDTTAEEVHATITDVSDSAVLGSATVLFTPIVSTGMPTTTQLRSSMNPSPAGQSVTYTATVSPDPGRGFVAFVDNDAFIGGCEDVPVDATGTATCSTTPRPYRAYPGNQLASHDIEVVYLDSSTSGSGAFASSSASLTQTLTTAAPQVIVQPMSQTVDAGQSVSFTSTASGAPLPNVQWQISTDGGATFSAIAGASATTFSTPTSSSDNGDQLQAVFSNLVGSASSNVVTLTVVDQLPPIPQAITFTSPAPSHSVVGGSVYSIAATGGGSGDPIIFTSGTPTVCNVSDTTVSFVSPGVCTINADQGGNANYSAAPTISQRFDVGPGSQAITFVSKPPSLPKAGGIYEVSATGGPSGNPVTLSIDGSGASACSIDGTRVALLAPGVCTVDANQSGSTEYLAAPEVQQSFLITVCGGTVTRCITSDAADQVRAGLFFSFTLTTTGSPTPKLKATGTLPKGVKFHRGTGIATVSGTPSKKLAPATYHLNVTATFGKGSPKDVVTQSFTLTVT